MTMPPTACPRGAVARRGRRCLLAVMVMVLVLLDASAAVPAGGAHGAGRAGDGPARITSVRTIDARTRDLTVHSPAVGASVPVRVILPRRWHTDKKATFPVLYMLHGGDDDYTSWTRETDIERLAETADFLVVMPDGGKAGYYSDWRTGTPRWETFHTGELVRLMESTYRASSSRAVMGLSMGGFGALNYAARHQGMFRYVAAMSSYVDLDDPAVRLSLALGSDRDGIDIRDVWGDPDKDRANWQAHSPAAMVRAFRGTRVHLSVGSGTPGPSDLGRELDVVVVSTVAEAALPKSVRAFASSLRRAGVEVTSHHYDPGTHSWPYWQRELHRVWPTVTKVLGQRGRR